MKYNLKEKATALRRNGLTYIEILKEVPVAKSTLCLWFHSVGLAEYHTQITSEKRLAAARKGAEAKHNKRIERTNDIIKEAIAEIGSLNRHDLWLMGVMLYWAEGSKEKSYKSGTGVQFTNMDPKMISFFLRWLKDICNINSENIIFEIYLHETHKHRLQEVILFWSQNIGIKPGCFDRIYFKKANLKTNRKNIDATYFGVIRMVVKSSTDLNRKIAGWTKGVVEFFR